MKKHSSKPTKQDVAILCYRVGETSVNMPIKNRNQIKLFKEPAFKVIGLWKPKNNIGKALGRTLVMDLVE